MEEQKGGSVVTEKPKGGSPEILEGFRGGTTEICLDNEDMEGGGGGGDREKHQKLLEGPDHFSEETIKGGDWLNFTLFSPESSPPPDDK